MKRMGIMLLILVFPAAMLCACADATDLKQVSGNMQSEAVSSELTNIVDLENDDEFGVDSAKVSSMAVSSKEVSSKGVSSITSHIKDTVELSAEQEISIKNDYLKFYFGDNPNYPGGYNIENVRIRNYYGTYNGGVVMIIDGYRGFAQALRDEEIAGITFKYSSSQGFEVWKNGNFYNLKSAYEKGILTKSDIETINGLHQDNYKSLSQ